MDLGDDRLTEQYNPRTARIDRADTAAIIDLLNFEDRSVPDVVKRSTDAIASVVDDVAGRLSRGGRLFYVGAGTSGRLGVLDAAECPPTFGTDPEMVQGIIAGGPEALVRAREPVPEGPFHQPQPAEGAAPGQDARGARHQANSAATDSMARRS